MIVLLDAGNSHFKWAQLRGGLISDVLSQEYDRQDRAHAVLAALESSDAPRRILVASVLGDNFREQFTRLANAHFGLIPEFVIPRKSGYGIHVAYDNPKEFGADRFSALVAARRGFQQSCIIVDCGTAATIDALTADGEHLGGLILPGLNLMRRSLIEHTARINVGLGNDDDGLFGRSTAQGVKAGTLRTLVGAIDRIVRDMTAHMIEHCGGSPVKHLMTGGTGNCVLPHLAADYHLEPRLVLQGLAIIAQAEDTLLC
jgi:type III pantothenate kinase